MDEVQAPGSVKRLVETFDRSLASRRTPAYNPETARQTDALVSELHGLTDKEVRIVEGDGDDL